MRLSEDVKTLDEFRYTVILNFGESHDIVI